jgi:hypothetical protein
MIELIIPQNRAGLENHDQQRQPHGQLREDVMEHDRESEVNPRQQNLMFHCLARESALLQHKAEVIGCDVSRSVRVVFVARHASYFRKESARLRWRTQVEAFEVRDRKSKVRSLTSIS